MTNPRTSPVYNFSAGPAMLPDAVMQQMQSELRDWSGLGVSVLEVSHRHQDFIAMAEQAEADLRELMGIPEHYKVLFLQGGASLQFAMLPMNLLRDRHQADYVHSGYWSGKAIAEARRYCEVSVVADGSAQQFTTLPDPAQWRLNPQAAYLHYTANETIHGIEFDDIPDSRGLLLVTDMSSNFLSRPLDVSRFALIYAGAQKNIGPAGLTLVIVREDMLGHCVSNAPSLCDYRYLAEQNSMANTPPTFSWYVAGLVFKWLKQQGGLAAMAAVNAAKAQLLYSCIDHSSLYRNAVMPAYRSRMNVPFVLADPRLDAVFLQEATAAGLLFLKGHRAVGGMRASLYNAMPLIGVETLVEFMQAFERRYG